MKNILYSLALILVFASCEKTADIDVPENPPMMAAFCFLEVDEYIDLRLEEVVPVFSRERREPGPILGADVQIIIGTKVINLVEVGQNIGRYVDTTYHEVIAGERYELRISKPGFPSLYAECQVPDFTPAAIRYEYSAVPDPSQGSDSVRRIGFYWNDQAGIANYYRLAGVAKFPGNSEAQIEFTSKNVSDIHKDGKEIFSGLGSFYSFDTGVPISSLSCTLELMVMDKHASAYMQSFDALYWNGDNPFGEPVIAYTNIQGGLGVFGALSRNYFTVKIY